MTKKLSQLTSRLRENSDVSESVMKKVQWLKENKIGQTAIQGVSDVLEAVDKHGVDRSVEDAKRILLDPEKREQFFVNIKNTALAYLMEYLPKVKVPKIVDTKDGVDYELSNIKISGFRVPADDVSLIVVCSHSLAFSLTPTLEQHSNTNTRTPTPTNVGTKLGTSFTCEKHRLRCQGNQVDICTTEFPVPER